MQLMLEIVLILLIAVTLPLLWKISESGIDCDRKSKKIEVVHTRLNKNFSTTVDGLVGN